MKLHTFLNNCYKKNDEEITHTRIKNTQYSIKGGSFSIKQDKWKDFMICYFNNIIKTNSIEYITEKQNEQHGPLCIDFDFRYESSITTRQHTEENIVEYLDILLNSLKKLVIFTQDMFQIFIFEKDNVNIVANDNITKDGIHIIICLDIDHKVKLMLRDEFIKNISSNNKLPLTNSWSNVYDEGICKAHTNWQMYGSCKPGNKPYKISYIFNTTYDNTTAEFDIEQAPVPSNDEIDFSLFEKISVQYTNHPHLTNTQFANSQLEFDNKKTKVKVKFIKNKSISLEDIKSHEDLDLAIDNFLNSIDSQKYYVKEAHHFTLILPPKFYEAGSYDNWIRVGWALKSTHNQLILTWIKLSSQSSTFSFDSISDLRHKWDSFDESGGLTHKSIHYWAQEHANKTDFDRIKNTTIDHFINISIDPKTAVNEHDIANLIYHLYKDKYVCVCVKNNIWYEFTQHKWQEIDSGNSLRLAMSQEIHDLYKTKLDELTFNGKVEENDNYSELMGKKTSDRMRKLADIITNLKRTQSKNNIFREAKELFYDPNFTKLMDCNPYLLCFNNGVYDFSSSTFRKGKYHDYITKSTQINYIAIDKCSTNIIKEINEFMEQLFPIQQLRNYMWQHLASTLMGTNDNQTFNIYTGNGRNGKSKLVELMTACLGDYKGSVPITLVTQSRRGIGSSSSEVVQLQGVRYAVMQEPSKGDKINEGIMKELTGGDPVQARGLYKDSVTFTPQFKLVVCTNTLFDITSNDDGTWRRIRVCDFMSKFKEKELIDNDPDEPYQFQVDKKLDSKFPLWKEVFISMLINIAIETKGNVQDCDLVLAKSGEYRQSQDYLAAYINERIEKQDDSVHLTWSELHEDFKDWYLQLYGSKIPKGQEVKDFIKKKFGKPQRVLDGTTKKEAWIGLTLQSYSNNDTFP